MKKILALLLASAMLMSCVACSPAAPAEQPAAPAEQPAAPAEQPAAPAEQPAAAETNEIGWYKTESGIWLPSEFGSTEDDFDAATETDSMSFEDMRAKFGDTITLPEGRPIRLVLLLKSLEVTYWQIMKSAAEEFTTRCQEQGVDITIEVRTGASEADAEGQLTVMRDVVTSAPDAIILAPITDTNCMPGVEEAHAAGIPVFGVVADFSGNDGFVAIDPLGSGAIAAEALAKAMNYEGEVAIVMGNTASKVCIYRTQGFSDWMAANAPNIKIVDRQESSTWSAADAYEYTSAWLIKYPNLKGIFTNNDGMAYGVCDAIAASGKTVGQDFFIEGLDGEPQAWEYVQQGLMSGTASSFAYVKSLCSIEVALRRLCGQSIPRMIYSPCLNYGVEEAAANVTDMQLSGYTYPVFN